MLSHVQAHGCRPGSNAQAVLAQSSTRPCKCVSIRSSPPKMQVRVLEGTGFPGTGRVPPEPCEKSRIADLQAFTVPAARNQQQRDEPRAAHIGIGHLVHRGRPRRRIGKWPLARHEQSRLQAGRADRANRQPLGSMGYATTPAPAFVRARSGWRWQAMPCGTARTWSTTS